ncbi:Hypothetical predicted protein [Pelobates cultripes]|uniref:Uncharacterized protein n=1 Tax=Pelobates cultripes TaxID=61616 RepID=A0AAD1RDJ0_PELCU|nr:Hypothetical predicted protein [Pelobates cultripes]
MKECVTNAKRMNVPKHTFGSAGHYEISRTANVCKRVFEKKRTQCEQLLVKKPCRMRICGKADAHSLGKAENHLHGLESARLQWGQQGVLKWPRTQMIQGCEVVITQKLGIQISKVK